jgi:hypothetical protein
MLKESAEKVAQRETDAAQRAERFFRKEADSWRDPVTSNLRVH